MKVVYPYFLRISGKVNAESKQEFQQTVQFLFNHLPPDCLEKSLSLNVRDADLYHIYLLWVSKIAMRRFKQSHDFEVLNGAWETLGQICEIQSGSSKGSQPFETNRSET